MNKNFIKLQIVIREAKNNMIKWTSNVDKTQMCSVLEDLSIHSVTIAKQAVLDYFNEACGNPGYEFAKFRELAEYYGFYARIVIVLGNGNNEEWFTFSEFIQKSAIDLVKHFKDLIKE